MPAQNPHLKNGFRQKFFCRLMIDLQPIAAGTKKKVQKYFANYMYIYVIITIFAATNLSLTKHQ